jgi:hypothetical protein
MLSAAQFSIYEGLIDDLCFEVNLSFHIRHIALNLSASDLLLNKRHTVGEHVRCMASAFNNYLLRERFKFERTVALYYFQSFIQILILKIYT